MLVRVLLVHFKCTASSTFSNSTFCPHRMRLCVVCWSENSNYFPIQHSLGGFYNRDGQCLLRGTDWLLNYISCYKSVDPGLPWEIKVNTWSAYCADCWPRSSLGGRPGSTNLSKGGHVDILSRAQLALLDYPDWGSFRALPISCKANTRVQHANTGPNLRHDK